MTGEDQRFFDVLGVALPRRDSGSLLRGVIENEAHLTRVEAGRASSRRGGTEIFGDAVRAAVRFHLILQRAERRGDARAHVVAKRHGAQKMGPADAELFACRERRGNGRATRMRMRGRVRIVGFIGMREHPVRHRGFQRTAHDVRGRDRRHVLALVRRGGFQRDAAGRQIGARDHGSKSIEDMIFGVLDHVGGERALASLAHVRGELRHHRADHRRSRAQRAKRKRQSCVAGSARARSHALQ